MQKGNSFLTLTTLIALLYACGGVIGNIEKYPFPNITSDSLKAAMDRVNHKYPELIKTDTSMYGNNNGNDFYYVLNMEGEKYIFKCNIVVYQKPYDKKTELSLTTATTWGKIMNIAPEMGFFEKRKYKRLFEKNILLKIEKEIGR